MKEVPMNYVNINFRSVRLFMLHLLKRLGDGVSVHRRFTTIQILIH